MFPRGLCLGEQLTVKLRLAMQVVYPPATERFAKSVASKDVTIKPFDKFAHDLYLDTCKVISSPL
jgi:hypothetical protein